MPFTGGMQTVMSIPAYSEWRAITFMSQVWHVPSRLAVYVLTAFIWSVATSVAVERIFSRGRLVLSHIRNRLSAQSTRAILCLGTWSKLGYVHDSDLNDAVSVPDDGSVPGNRQTPINVDK